MNIDEDELRRLVARRAAIEHTVFTQPPIDYAGYCLHRGRWMEVNDHIVKIEEDIRKANSDEEQS